MPRHRTRPPALRVYLVEHGDSTYSLIGYGPTWEERGRIPISPILAGELHALGIPWELRAESVATGTPEVEDEQA